MVSSVNVLLEVPEDLARLLAPTDGEVARRILELALLRMVQDGVLSSGRAAEVLGILRTEFWRMMYEHRVPLFDLTAEELREELRTAEAFMTPDPA